MSQSKGGGWEQLAHISSSMLEKWIYIWLAFAVKVEVKEEASRWGCPSKYIWVDIAPKREKIDEKWHFQFEDVTFCYLYLAITPVLVFSFPFYIVFCSRLRPPYVLAPCICAVPTCVHVYVRAHRPRMYAPSRARSNRNVVFLLSQVSHNEWKTEDNQENMQEKSERKKRVFRCFHTGLGKEILKYTKNNR